MDSRIRLYWPDSDPESPGLALAIMHVLLCTCTLALWCFLCLQPQRLYMNFFKTMLEKTALTLLPWIFFFMFWMGGARAKFAGWPRGEAWWGEICRSGQGGTPYGILDWCAIWRACWQERWQCEGSEIFWMSCRVRRNGPPKQIESRGLSIVWWLERSRWDLIGASDSLLPYMYFELACVQLRNTKS